MPPNWTPGVKFDLIQIPPPKLPPGVCFKFTISRGFLSPYHSSSVLRRNDNSPGSDRRSPISSKTWAIPSTNLLLALWKYLMASRGPILQEGLMNLSWGKMVALSLNARGTQRVCYFTSFQVSPTCFPSESVHTGPRSHRVLQLGENEKFWNSVISHLIIHSCMFSSNVSWVLLLFLTLIRVLSMQHPAHKF